MKNNIKKTIPEQNLPAFLRETRRKIGLTVEEIAELLETTSRSYRRWETGENDPSGQAIAKLYQLREQNSEIFSPKQPFINVPNLAEQQTTFLEQLNLLLTLFKQQGSLIQEQQQQHQQQQELAKSLQLAQQSQPQSQQRPSSQQTNYQQTQQQPNQPLQQDMDRLFQLLKKLENRLIFLEDKCGYPYQSNQYTGGNTTDRHYKKRNR